MKRKQNIKKTAEIMSNSWAIDEIMELIADYSSLREKYDNLGCPQKTVDGLNTKVDALHLAVVALDHVKAITGV